MKTTFPVQFLLAMVLMAVSLAQIFGLQRGYLAEVDGRWVETKASHHHACDTLEQGHFVCFVPHEHASDLTVGADHHKAFGYKVHHTTDDHRECGDSPVREHVPLKQALELVKAPTQSISLSAPLVAVLETWQMLEISRISSLHHSAKETIRTWGLEYAPPRPMAEKISRCVVLLI